MATTSFTGQTVVVGINATNTPVLVRYDHPSGAQVGTIPLANIGHSVDVTPDGHYAVVSLQLTNGAAIVDLTTNSVVATIPVGNGPTEVSITPDGREAFISNEHSPFVSIIDISARAVTRTLPQQAEGIAFSPDGSEFWLVPGLGTVSNDAKVYRTSDLALLGTVPGIACRGANATMSADGAFVYVTDDACGKVIVISTATRTVTRQISAPNAWATALSPDGSTIYVTEPGPGQLEVFDTGTGARINTIYVAPGVHEIAATPDGATVYVTALFGNTSVIDLATNAVARTLTGFTRLVGVAPIPQAPLQAPSSTSVFLHGSGGTANPPTLFLDDAAPTTSTPDYQDSPSIKFAGGNVWKEVGTWDASASVVHGTVSTLGDAHLWLGLENSDDNGTRFDVRVEARKNGTLFASGETLCVQNVVRNADQAKEVTVAFAPFAAQTFNGTSDAISIKVLTRIGTNGSSASCGGHANAVGLRTYFDAATRQARLEASGTVPVAPAPVAFVEVSPSATSVVAGQTVQLTAVTKDANGNVLAGRWVSWTSGAGATVNANGLVTGGQVGTVTITATSEGVSGTAQVTVEPGVVDVAVTARSNTFFPGMSTPVLAEWGDGTLLVASAYPNATSYHVSAAGPGAVTSSTFLFSGSRPSIWIPVNEPYPEIAIGGYDRLRAQSRDNVTFWDSPYFGCCSQVLGGYAIEPNIGIHWGISGQLRVDLRTGDNPPGNPGVGLSDTYITPGHIWEVRAGANFVVKRAWLAEQGTQMPLPAAHTIIPISQQQLHGALTAAMGYVHPTSEAGGFLTHFTTSGMAWSKVVPGVGYPVITGQDLVVSASSDQNGHSVLALNLSDGNQAWQVPVSERVKDIVVGDGGNLYVLMPSSMLVLDAATGAVRKSYINLSFAVEMLLSNGTMYIVTQPVGGGARLIALAVASTNYDVLSPWPVRFGDNQRTRHLPASRVR